MSLKVAKARSRPSFEVYVVWNLIYKDLPASVGIGVMWSIVAWHSTSRAFAALPLVVLKSLVYFIAYVLPHCIANQISGVEEDRVNKPWRLVPSGALTLTQMRSRLVVSLALFLGVGFAFGVFEWALAWSVIVVLNNFGSASNRWYVKDLWMGLGMFALMSPAWQIVAPTTAEARLWTTILSVAVFVLVPMQDLRDIEGDRVRGRVTLPIALGEIRARGFLAASFLALPALFFAMLAPAPWRDLRFVVWLGMGGWAWILAYRVWFRRSMRQDHDTYQAFCWLFVGWEGLALLVL